MNDNDAGKQLNCLICSVEVSVNASYSIFYTVIPHSGTLLANSIQKVIRKNVEQSTLPSTFMCTKCFSLFEELDYSEEKCIKLRKDIVGFFKRSCHKNGYELEDVQGIGCQTEEITSIDTSDHVLGELKVESCDSAASDIAEELNSSQGTVSEEECTPENSKENKKLSTKQLKRKGNPCKQALGNSKQASAKDSPDKNEFELKSDEVPRRRRYVHPCRLCGRLFRRPCEVKQHLLSHGGAKPFQCRDCGKRFGSKSGAGIHALKQHGKDVGVENIIDVCHEPITSVEVTLSDGNGKDSNSKTDEEGLYGASGDSDSDDDFEWKMEDHEDIFDQDKDMKVDVSDLDIDQKDDYLDDKGIEVSDADGDKSELCIKKEEEDDKESNSSKDIKECKVQPKFEKKPRNKVAPKPDPAQLLESMAKAEQKNARRRERRARAKKESFPKPPKHKCEVCGKMWRTMSEYKSHVATHSDERPYICEICGQAYKHKPALDVHVGMHNGINPFSCPYCNKAFTQKGALQRHLPIHTGEAPYQCELCGKRFVHHTSFNMHTLAHTGQKSYKCKVCGLALLSGSHLKRHSRVHTGERPYQCQTCGKRFAERYNLVAHTRVHDPLGSGNAKEGAAKKIHRCQLCGAGFDRKPKLEDHLALSHNKISDSDDSRKWVGHLISNELTQQSPCSSTGPPVGPVQIHQGPASMHVDPPRRRPPDVSYLSHLPPPDHEVKPHQSVRPEMSQHQQSWHHMIFGAKAMEAADMMDGPGAPIQAALESQHRLLSEMSSLGGLGPGPGSRHMLSSSLMGGGHPSQPLHIPNASNPHSLLSSRVNMFSSDN